MPPKTSFKNLGGLSHPRSDRPCLCSPCSINILQGKKAIKVDNGEAIKEQVVQPEIFKIKLPESTKAPVLGRGRKVKKAEVAINEKMFNGVDLEEKANQLIIENGDAELNIVSPQKLKHNKRKAGLQTVDKVMEDSQESHNGNTNGEVLCNSSNDQKPLEKTKRGRKKAVVQSGGQNSTEALQSETDMGATNVESSSNSKDYGTVKKYIPAKLGRKQAEAKSENQNSDKHAYNGTSEAKNNETDEKAFPAKRGRKKAKSKLKEPRHSEIVIRNYEYFCSSEVFLSCDLESSYSSSEVDLASYLSVASTSSEVDFSSDEKSLPARGGKKKADNKSKNQNSERTEKQESSTSTGEVYDLTNIKNVSSEKAFPAKRGRKKANDKSEDQNSKEKNQLETDNGTTKVEIIASSRNIDTSEASSKTAKRGKNKAIETALPPINKQKQKKLQEIQNVSSSTKSEENGDSHFLKEKPVETLTETVKTAPKEEKRKLKTELKSSKKVKEIDENRQLRVTIKRCDSLDEMANNEILLKVENESKDNVKVKTAKGPAKSGGRGKRTKEDGGESSKPAKIPKESSSKSKKDQIPDVSLLDFGNKSTTKDGKPWNLKIASWNINGVRAWLEKNGLSYLHQEKPDVLCLQETKCSADKLPDQLNVEGYYCHWLAGDKDGYSGVGIISKEKPTSITDGIGMEEHDKEGRVITAEYENFYLVATYVPNAGRGLVRLEYRMQWDKDFCDYLKKLDEKKPVVLCGDLNVAHEEIDIANPKTNKKNAGFTKEEREGFSTLLSEGFVDTYRHLYPDTKAAYTFWTYMMNARAKNVGWRLDYFVISQRLTDNLCDSVIRKEVYGSDHCPIALLLYV